MVGGQGASAVTSTSSGLSFSWNAYTGTANWPGSSTYSRVTSARVMVSVWPPGGGSVARGAGEPGIGHRGVARPHHRAGFGPHAKAVRPEPGAVARQLRVAGDGKAQRDLGGEDLQPAKAPDGQGGGQRAARGSAGGEAEVELQARPAAVCRRERDGAEAAAGPKTAVVRGEDVREDRGPRRRRARWRCRRRRLDGRGLAGEQERCRGDRACGGNEQGQRQRTAPAGARALPALLGLFHYFVYTGRTPCLRQGRSSFLVRAAA